VRQPIPAEPGQLERYDCEYKRNGTANLFVFLDAHRSWRKVKVTDRRAVEDFAICMRELLSRGRAYSCRVGQSVNPHGQRALPDLPSSRSQTDTAPPGVPLRPKHASWLNMVEIEIGVLRTQCLDRRIPTREILESEIGAWERQRNASGDRIKWMFTTDKARDKMGRAYPKIAGADAPPAKES
jgi:hypothetical protein